MKSGKNLTLWILWLATSVSGATWLSVTMISGTDQAHLMPGPLSPGHHQLVDNCAVCHTENLAGSEVLQQACIDCHGDIREKPFDSHPAAKFEDPRNADRLEAIDAMHCVTCHVEHRPGITLKDGVTQPVDLCFHCHKDVGKNRPSHLELKFDSCKNAGCHNFHNNRAIYTDFLVKHKDDPALKPGGHVPAREFADLLEEIVEYPRDRYPIEPLLEADIDAPRGKRDHADIEHAWLSSGHARSGVNCSACHVLPEEASGVKDTWVDSPGEASCKQCHSLEVARFKRGKHGMRLAANLPSMQVADARLPMAEDAKARKLTCSSCHGAHDVNTVQAAVEGCLGCHADEHSLAYRDSPHHALWQKEVAGEASAGTGVSCATCHMPRIDFDVNDWMSRKLVDHNQSDTLSPNTKMIRPACLHCHGLDFSLRALVDVKLINNNFTGSPATELATMKMAREDNARAMKEIEGNKE